MHIKDSLCVMLCAPLIESVREWKQTFWSRHSSWTRPIYLIAVSSPWLSVPRCLLTYSSPSVSLPGSTSPSQSTWHCLMPGQLTRNISSKTRNTKNQKTRTKIGKHWEKHFTMLALRVQRIGKLISGLWTKKIPTTMDSSTRTWSSGWERLYYPTSEREGFIIFSAEKVWTSPEIFPWLFQH